MPIKFTVTNTTTGRHDHESDVAGSGRTIDLFYDSLGRIYIRRPIISGVAPHLSLRFSWAFAVFGAGPERPNRVLSRTMRRNRMISVIDKRGNTMVDTNAYDGNGRVHLQTLAGWGRMAIRLSARCIGERDADHDD